VFACEDALEGGLEACRDDCFEDCAEALPFPRILTGFDQTAPLHSVSKLVQLVINSSQTIIFCHFIIYRYKWRNTGDHPWTGQCASPGMAACRTLNGLV
jgi:hypothetical protein